MRENSAHARVQADHSSLTMDVPDMGPVNDTSDALAKVDVISTPGAATRTSLP